MSAIYYCTNDKNNDCPKRKDCKRYLDANQNNCKVTLYKASCVNSNGRVLLINKEKIKEGENNKKETD